MFRKLINTTDDSVHDRSSRGSRAKAWGLGDRRGPPRISLGPQHEAPFRAAKPNGTGVCAAEGGARRRRFKPESQGSESG